MYVTIKKQSVLVYDYQDQYTPLATGNIEIHLMVFIHE